MNTCKYLLIRRNAAGSAAWAECAARRRLQNPWVPLQIRGQGNGALLGRGLVCEVNTRADFVVYSIKRGPGPAGGAV